MYVGDWKTNETTNYYKEIPFWRNSLQKRENLDGYRNMKQYKTQTFLYDKVNNYIVKAQKCSNCFVKKGGFCKTCLTWICPECHKYI